MVKDFDANGIENELATVSAQIAYVQQVTVEKFSYIVQPLFF
jgi:hypothetical protein